MLTPRTELHRHLDVALRTSTLLELAQERGLEAQSTSLDAFTQKLIMRAPMRDLGTVLAQFALFQYVLDRPDVLERITYEAIEDCHLEGTHRVELRYSPSFISHYSKLKWEDALDGIEAGLHRGMKDFPVKAGLLCIASRDYGTESVDQTVEFFLRNQHRFIGLDLAGDESRYPSRLFETSFKKAVRAGANITIHAGESEGPESVWEAIDLLGAKRIGHGIHSIRDTRLLETLRDRDICLEVCPTSNWLTQAVPTLAEHPLLRLFQSGVPTSINTDDPGIFGNTLPGEISVSRQHIGLTDAMIEKCFQNAYKASFLPTD